MISQVSLTRLAIFLFLDVPTLKLRMIIVIIIIIIIIILPTDRPKIILSTARTAKN